MISEQTGSEVSFNTDLLGLFALPLTNRITVFLSNWSRVEGSVITTSDEASMLLSLSALELTVSLASIEFITNPSLRTSMSAISLSRMTFTLYSVTFPIKRVR